MSYFLLLFTTIICQSLYLTTSISTTTHVLQHYVNRLTPVVYLKLYETVVVFYAIIFGVCTVGLIGMTYPPLRRLLHQRIAFPLPAIFSLWPYGICMGEALLLAAFMALQAYWFWYWSEGWTYRRKTGLMSFLSIPIHIPSHHIPTHHTASPYTPLTHLLDLLHSRPLELPHSPPFSNYPTHTPTPPTHPRTLSTRPMGRSASCIAYLRSRLR